MSARQFIRLPNGRRVSLAAYAFAWRRLKSESPGAMVRGFFDSPASAADTLAEFARGLTDRINKRGALALSECRAHPSTLATIRTPRARLAPDQFASLNRHARRKLAHRAPE